MIPITISFFTKRASDRHQSALPLALAYGAGIVLVFVLIGVVFGAVIIPFATHPITNLVIALVFFYFALVLFGVAKLNPPPALMNLAGKAASTGGYLGVFLMGTTLVLTSFTCTAPFVGTLLATGAKDGELGRVALGMGVFGLTMAVPFVLLSLVPGKLRALPKSGEWMNTLKFFLGFVEIAAALKFLSNVDLVAGWRVISREFFLFGWAVIFLAAAVYLFGIWRPHGERSRVGPVRVVGGGAVLLFSGYLFWAMTGQRLDFVMSALAPPYTGGKLFPQWYDEGIVWSRVIDDYEGAVRLATDEKKLVLLNFTGVTCSVCRNMEENVFPTPEVRKVLGRYYVEARLHTDAGPRMDEFRALEQELADTVANPVYVILDPADGSTKGQKAGFSGASTFARFLEAPLQVTN
jgi:thiol:disulfide interchange protein DsbD